MKALLGKKITLHLPNGEDRNAQFAIVELNDIMASHDEYTFAPTPQYPTSPDGHNINDRNYSGDKQAQAQVAEYAHQLQPDRLISTSRTPSGTPIINKEGFVVSGNNRTMSLKRAIKDYPQRYFEYKEFLREELEAYGFRKYTSNKPNHFLNSGGKLEKFEQPVLVRIDYDIPALNTAELAKYNMDTKKGKRPIDKAIELSSVLRTNPGCRDGIAQILSEYERLSDFYEKPNDQKKVIDLMVKCNLVTEQEKPEYYTPEIGFGISGKQFLETVLASIILKKEPLLVSENDGVREMRKVIVTSLPVLMSNQILPEGSLIEDINTAVLLQSDMRQSGLPFASQLAQISAFGTQRLYSEKSLYLNRLMDKGQRRFKNAIDRYNNSVGSNSGMSFFETEKLSPSDVFDKVIKLEAMRDNKDAPIEQKAIDNYIRTYLLPSTPSVASEKTHLKGSKELKVTLDGHIFNENQQPKISIKELENEIKTIQSRLNKKGLNKAESELLNKKLTQLRKALTDAHNDKNRPNETSSKFYKTAVLGNILPITLVNGEVHRIQYAIIEMRDAIASHNELDFSQNMSYPTNPDGTTTNDRDYATDKESQNQIINGAKSIDVEKFFTITDTPSGTPILNSDGIAYSGNKRSQIIKRAAALHLDQYQKYRDYLCDHHKKFGFTLCKNNASTFASIESDSLITFQQPMLVRIDLDADPYTNEVSAKYNKDSVKFPLVDKEGKRRIDNEALTALENHLDRLPQTKDLHTQKDIYTPERRQLHQSIIKEMETGNTCIKRAKPICIFTGGAPGSGKSTFMRKYYNWLLNPSLFLIDSDEVRAKLPEYEGWNASLTHEETSDIVNELIEYIAPKDCRFDVLIDGTFTNLRKYKAMIKKVQELGYDTYAIFMHIDPKISMQRALERYQQTGRYVPRHIIEDVNQKGDSVFQELKGSVNGWIEVDGVSSAILSKGGEDLPKDRDYGSLSKPLKQKDTENKVKKSSEKPSEKYSEKELKMIRSRLADGTVLNEYKFSTGQRAFYQSLLLRKHPKKGMFTMVTYYLEKYVRDIDIDSIIDNIREGYFVFGAPEKVNYPDAYNKEAQETQQLIEGLNLSAKYLKGKPLKETQDLIEGLALSLKYL